MWRQSNSTPKRKPGWNSNLSTENAHKATIERPGNKRWNFHSRKIDLCSQWKYIASNITENSCPEVETKQPKTPHITSRQPIQPQDSKYERALWNSRKPGARTGKYFQSRDTKPACSKRIFKLILSSSSEWKTSLFMNLFINDSWNFQRNLLYSCKLFRSNTRWRDKMLFASKKKVLTWSRPRALCCSWHFSNHEWKSEQFLKANK